MSPTVKWIISGILFLAVAYFFYRVSKKSDTASSNPSIGGSGSGGNQSVRTEEKK